MAGPDSGGGDIGARLHAQGIGGNAQPSDSSAPPSDLSDLINKLFDQISKWTKLVVGQDLSKLGKTSMLANLNIEQAGFQVSKEINQASIAKGTQGGALASIASSVFQWDFSKIQLPPIDPLTMNSGVEISAASLGDLPIQLAHVGSGAGMGAGFSMNA